MSKIKLYPTATPAADDKVLFTDVSDSDNTKNTTVADLAVPIASVPRSFVYLYKDSAEEDLTAIVTEYGPLTISALEGFKTDDFTVSSAGLITYTGATTKPVKVDGIIEISNAGNNNVVTIAMEYNGTVVDISSQTLISANNDPLPFVGIGVLQMHTNDTIRFMIKGTSAIVVTTESVNVVLSQL
jgi:hypothetical protein